MSSENWPEQVIQAIPEGVIVIDAAGKIVFLNPGMERITGRPGAEALGQRLGEVLNVPETDLTQLMEPPVSSRPMRVVTRGDRPLTLAVTSTRVNSHLVLVLRDVTEEETNRQYHSYFLANITHEFRTPLSGLNASLELLLDDAGYLSPAEMNELLYSIYLSASGLQALVDNLLESVHIESGRFTIRRHPIELNQVLASALRTMQPLLDRRRQSLSLTEPLHLPTLHADPTRLVQVLINLLSNASKYSPLDSTIDLSLDCIGNQLRFAVADRGPGIAPADRATLFRRFVRLGERSADQYGIGLGLSVVKAIVEGHGGEVGVDERPGGGSIFWFTLPLTGVENEGADR